MTGLDEDIATGWHARVKRLTDAINAEVDDLLDLVQYGPEDRAAQGLTVLGEHLLEAAIDMIDVGHAAFTTAQIVSGKRCSLDG
jgi:hypothetical protein